MILNTNDLLAILPFIIIVAWAILLIVADLFIPKERKGIMALLTGIGLLVALGFAVARVGGQTVAFNGMIVYDGFAVFLTVLFLGSGLAAVALSYDYLNRMEMHRNEFYILLLFSISGMILMAMAADLILVFMALELLSIPLYVLAGFALPRQDSEEAALKYFLLGAFAGGFVVYGVALVFGATGSTGLANITASISAGKANLAILAVGAALILVGFGFKVAAVPFHMWTPDVYQGSPSPVTAFMAVCAKAAGFAALMRVFVTAFPAIAEDITPILWALSILTMILGNVLAIAQSNIKRLLAYSSIAQAGYILMALVPYGNGDVSQDAIASALFYLMAYAITTFGAWAVVIALEKSEGRGLALDDYAGLARQISCPGSRHDGFYAVSHRCATHLGFCCQILSVSHRHRKRVYWPGSDWRVDIARFGLLLLARGGYHVHVGWSAGDTPRKLDRHHSFYSSHRHSGVNYLLDPFVSMGIPGDHAGVLGASFLDSPYSLRWTMLNART